MQMNGLSKQQLCLVIDILFAMLLFLLLSLLPYAIFTMQTIALTQTQVRTYIFFRVSVKMRIYAD